MVAIGEGGRNQWSLEQWRVRLESCVEEMWSSHFHALQFQFSLRWREGVNDHYLHANERDEDAEG